MAIALGTALAISAAAAAAGSAAKAKIQSNAAKKASEQQVQGTEKAAGYQQQAMNQLHNIWSPYVNAGAGAMGTLSRLTTPGAGARYASPGPPNTIGPQPFPGQGGPPPMPQQIGPPGQRPPGMLPDGRPVAGPYPMAAGGDFMVNQPTMFLAGEAGPERATFSGRQPMMGATGAAAMRQPFGRQMARAGGAAAAGMGPFGRMFGGGPRGGPGPGGPSGDIRQALMNRYSQPQPTNNFAQMGGTFGRIAQMMAPPGQKPPGMLPEQFTGQPQPQQVPQRPPGMLPEQAPDRSAELAAYRQQGEAAGQDMSWMDQPGALAMGPATVMAAQPAQDQTPINVTMDQMGRM